MGLVLKLSLLVATLCVLHVYGYDEEDEYKRALEAFRLMQREPERQEEILRALERRKFMDCKTEGEGCRGLPKCCGDFQCYWKEGYSMIKEGECVKCVEEGQKCQRHGQCCKGTICDKGNALWVDGNCRAPRTSGSCYRNKQCAGSCQKKWWQIHGACTSS